MLKTGCLPIARLMQIDRRHLTPFTRFKLSPFHLTSRFFNWKVHTGQESNQLCVAVKQSAATASTESSSGETLLFVSLFVLIATTTSAKEGEKSEHRFRSSTKPMYNHCSPMKHVMRDGIFIPSSWGNPEDSLWNKNTHWPPTHRHCVKISIDVILIGFFTFYFNYQNGFHNSTTYYWSTLYSH